MAKKDPKFSRFQENEIARFRGLPLNTSRARIRDSKPIGDLLDSCLESYSIGKRTTRDVLMENWKELVGSSYAHRCCPVEITKRGELVIRVTNSTIRSELTFYKRKLLAKIRSLDECDGIRELIFRAG